MTEASRLKVVLAWHMHQPDYRDGELGEYLVPWTYLHAIKDYVDMAAHLEAVPGARAVVNFSPILLEQLEDYAHQLGLAVGEGRLVRDPVLRALQVLPAPEDRAGRSTLVAACRRANVPRLVDRFPAYRRLYDVAGTLAGDPGALGYLDDRFLVDLVVWYHLAWLGETVRRTDLAARELLDKGEGFDAADRALCLRLVAGLVEGLRGRYRRLAGSGGVELSVSPYAHPMLPLLLDWGVARESEPGVTLPPGPGYPRGRERARWHMEEAIAVYERYFGERPLGCWPSEGGVSDEALGLIERHGFRWAASGESVARASLSAAGIPHPGEAELCRPFRVGEGSIALFFRSDRLSDGIGFTYADWHADDAVGHFVHELEQIAGRLDEPGRHVVPVILDGENAWEFYPDNGYHFIRGLYERLAEHPDVELTTFARALGEDLPATPIPRLVAGSWVYGTFSTWIGSPQKNRGWELLAAAAAAVQEARHAGRLGRLHLARVERQLAVCEGSDWCWWFADHNPGDSVQAFDAIYRRHLRELYRLLGRVAPDTLAQPFAAGGGSAEMGGVMRRGAEA